MMKQYSPVFRPVPFSSKQSKKEPFFEPQPFLKVANGSLQVKWFASNSNNFFLLAINGLDAQLIAEIKKLLKYRARLDDAVCGEKNLAEIMGAVDEFLKKDAANEQSNPRLLTEDNPAGKPEPQLSFLDHVNEKIEENLSNEHFRHTDLAKLLCCCEMQLYRKVKQLSKLSPANYIRRYRLQRSLRSLQSSDLPISQICFNMGFRSLEYFSRSFKKEFGVCPSVFRSGQNVEIVQTNV